MKIIVQHVLDKRRATEEMENENNIITKLTGLSSEVEKSQNLQEMGKIPDINGGSDLVMNDFANGTNQSVPSNKDETIN